MRAEVMTEVAAVKGEVAEVKAAVLGEVADIKAAVQGELAAVTGEVSQIRAELIVMKRDSADLLRKRSIQAGC
jgi:hypothetical protein